MRAAIKDGLRPDKQLSVTEWANTYRYLDRKAASMPGPYSVDVTPYLREIMDELGEHSTTEEVIVMKGAQLGFTDAGLNWIGYTMHISPCPFMMVQPTKDVAELVSKTRIQPMIDSSPELSKKVKPPRSRDSGNTLLKKEYPGGILRMTGANSAVGLRNMPVKRLMLDEVDAYPPDVDGEGDVISLAKKRQSTFRNRKALIISTPGDKQTSIIEKEFNKTDKRYWFIPCPSCGSVQHLIWEQLQYEYNERNNEVKNVSYKCKHCNDLIPEMKKTEMLAAGRWIPTEPDNQNKKKKGYHLNSLYSPLGWLSWEDLARDYEEAKGDNAKLKAFVNTSLGLSYEQKGEKPDYEKLFERKCDYQINTIPSDQIAFLTAGVDVQKDRIEVEVVGWVKGKKSYSIVYQVLDGLTASQDSEVWDKLRELLDQTWVSPDGRVLKIRKAFIDSGYNSQQVYSFCNSVMNKIAVPVKGKDTLQTIIGSSKPVNIVSNGKAIGKTKVTLVGVNIIKEELYGWIALSTEKAGYCYFPQYSEEYFKGLLSEEVLETDNKKTGRTKREWVKKYKRNEPLDCRVYARAAAHAFGMDKLKDHDWDKYLRPAKSIKKTRPQNDNYLGGQDDYFGVGEDYI